jgi:hypothetical protein
MYSFSVAKTLAAMHYELMDKLEALTSDSDIESKFPSYDPYEGRP